MVFTPHQQPFLSGERQSSIVRRPPTGPCIAEKRTQHNGAEIMTRTQFAATLAAKAAVPNGAANESTAIREFLAFK